MNSPDYSNYSLNELYDALNNIDQTNNQERYQIIVNEIQKREKVQNSLTKEKSEPVDGIKVIAIISIIFGALCFLSNLSSFFTADLIDIGKDILEKAKESSSLPSDLDKIFQIPDWYKNWIKIQSIISVLIAIGIIITAKNFMYRKKNFNMLLIGALTCNIIISYINLYVNPLSISLDHLAMIFLGLWSNAVELIIIVSILLVKK